MMPTPNESKQLCRLRALRVKRAEERQAAAKLAMEQAMAAVRARQAEIAATRHSIDELAHAIVNELAPSLPRWAAQVRAERDRLDDRLERAEYALTEDEQVLEEATEKLREARVDLARARAREDVVLDIAADARRARLRESDRKVEVELEDRVIKRTSEHAVCSEVHS